jgi:hypothetical protein
MESTVRWDLNGPGATLICGPLEAFARLDAQGLDVIASKWRGQAVPGISVLCSAGPTQIAGQLDVAERYVRGNDFIASCKPAGQQRLAPQVYWRASFHPAFNAARIELVLSAQTDLLDSGPAWSLSSAVRDAALFYANAHGEPSFVELTRGDQSFVKPAESAEHLFVFRFAALGLTYAQMVHPSDFASAEIDLDGEQPLVLNTTLFPERLEKGVIRRGRVCGWFLPAENDLETAVKLAREFVGEPLPLTA